MPTPSPENHHLHEEVVIIKAVKDIIGIINAKMIIPPLELKAEYKKTELTAILQADGTILFDSESYTSPSTAAGSARNKVIGPPKSEHKYHKGKRKCHQTNGWVFWKYYEKKTGQWELLEKLRKEYLNMKKNEPFNM